MKNCKILLAGGVAATALFLPFAAMAQDSSEKSSAREQRAADTDIIVTATRREETVLEVPLSIAAYSQETLDLKGVRNIDDLSRITPGLTITSGFGGIKYIAVRGLSSIVGATMTGVYIDDTPVQVRSLSVSTNFYPALFDLERVEVLRGPQGTLFGSGSMGGAVRFIQSEPGLKEYSGSVRAELGFTEGGDPSYEIGAAVGGPIVEDKVGFRISGYRRRDGGYIDRVPYVPSRGTPEKNSNPAETTVANLALSFAPVEGLTITPSVFYQQIDREGIDQFWTFVEGSPRTPLRRFTSGEGVDSFNRDRALIYSLKAEYDLGPVTLINSTSILDRKTRSIEDGSAYFLDLFRLPFDFSLPAFFDERTSLTVESTQRSFTQELRLQSNPDPDSRLSYVFGLFYQNSRQTLTERDFAATPGAYLLPTEIDGVFARAFDRSRDRQYAAFGQVDYRLSDRLTATAGARVSRLEFDFFNTIGGSFFGGDSTASGRTSETPITPKFGIEYRATPDLMIYASAAKGFRPGGANPGGSPVACAADLAALGLSAVPRQYRSDSVWSYEVGAKGRMGRAVTFAASAFNIDWSNVQRPRLLSSCGVAFIENLGEARSRGFDAQITLTPAEGLSLDVGVGYMDTTQRTTVPTPSNATVQGTITRKGDRFAVPWIVTAALDYETSLGRDDLDGYAHVQYDLKSAYSRPSGNIEFNPVSSRSDDQHFVSARAGIRRGPVDVSLYVNNLLNSRDILALTNFSPSERVLVNTYRPRTFGITAGYRF